MKLICPNCNTESEHKILSMKSTKDGVEYLLKCQNCGYTYTKVFKDEKMRQLRVVWSWKDKSEVKRISKLEEDIISVGDEMPVEGINSQGTGIESGGKRVKRARVKDIDTLWMKRFDKVIVKVSVNRGSRTASYEIIAHPDEEFYIGDIIDLDRGHAVIHKIKTKERFIMRGSALARDIVRIYAKEVREVREY
jgi:uncharacterized Zn finger protein